MTYITGLGALTASSTTSLSTTAIQGGSQPSLASGASATSTSISDQASLSTTSTLLAQALNASDVRLDKVDSLQQAIASGSYHVPAAAVADSLLQSMTA